MKKGKVIGKQQGMDQVNQLNIILANQNRKENIIKAANDLEYQKKLLEEFSL